MEAAADRGEENSASQAFSNQSLGWVWWQKLLAQLGFLKQVEEAAAAERRMK